MKKMIFVGVMMAFVAAPAFAQDAGSTTTEGAQSNIISAAHEAVSSRQTLTTTDGARLGRVTRVEDDGSVGIIYRGRYIIISASTLSVEDGQLVTSMSRADVARAR